MIALSIFSSGILKHVFISIILVQAPYFTRILQVPGCVLGCPLGVLFTAVVSLCVIIFERFILELIKLSCYILMLFSRIFTFLRFASFLFFVFIFESSCSLWFRGIAIRKIFEKTPVMESFVVKENSVQFFCW